MKRLASILCAGLLVLSAASAFAISTSNVAEPIEKGEPTQVPAAGPTPAARPSPPHPHQLTPLQRFGQHLPTRPGLHGGLRRQLGSGFFYRYVPTSNQNGVTVSLCGSAMTPSSTSWRTASRSPATTTSARCSRSWLSPSSPAGPTSSRERLLELLRPVHADISGAPVPCIPTCPAGTQIEGEPLCGPNYVDTFNGGCNSTPASSRR